MGSIERRSATSNAHASTQLERAAPKLVGLLGGIGLGSTLAYFLGVYLIFDPEWQAWADFFVPRAPLLMLIPYSTLSLYLFARSRLSGWLVRRGAHDEAVAWAEARLVPSLLRSRSEVHLHRVALARVALAHGDYALVDERLSQGFSPPRSGRIGLHIQRLRMEAALRREDLVGAMAAFDLVREQPRPALERASILGCRLELAVRAGDEDAYRRILDEVLWLDQPCPRVDLARALHALRFGQDEDAWAKGLAWLERSSSEIIAEVPGRQRGLGAVRAGLLDRLGRHEQARLALEQASMAAGDARSAYVFDQIAASVEIPPNEPPRSP